MLPRWRWASATGSSAFRAVTSSRRVAVGALAARGRQTRIMLDARALRLVLRLPVYSVRIGQRRRRCRSQHGSPRQGKRPQPGTGRALVSVGLRLPKGVVNRDGKGQMGLLGQAGAWHARQYRQGRTPPRQPCHRGDTQMRRTPLQPLGTASVPNRSGKTSLLAIDEATHRKSLRGPHTARCRNRAGRLTLPCCRSQDLSSAASAWSANPDGPVPRAVQHFGCLCNPLPDPHFRYADESPSGFASCNSPTPLKSLAAQMWRPSSRHPSSKHTRTSSNSLLPYLPQNCARYVTAAAAAYAAAPLPPSLRGWAVVGPGWRQTASSLTRSHTSWTRSEKVARATSWRSVKS